METTTMTRTPLDLPAARRLRDALTDLLRQEQAAMADFLLALADFDRRRGWELLGHASLFAFLRVELGLSSGATFWRMSAARLLQRFPELIDPLRDGRLCLTTTAELAKVLTDENRAEVLPRFLGLSAREAKEVVAELQPREAPATRAVVTAALRSEFRQPVAPQGCFTLATATADLQAPSVVPPTQLRAPETTVTSDARRLEIQSEVEPLTPDLRRLHVTVSRRFMKKLDAARDGLSHRVRAATPEQVLEAALDLLLEKQARSRDQGRCTWPLDGGGTCGSTHRLEFDHVVPWARDGAPTVEGTRILCRHHNVLAARQAFGEQCMARYTGPRAAPGKSA